jgi:hypothetical protein
VRLVYVVFKWQAATFKNGWQVLYAVNKCPDEEIRYRVQVFETVCFEHVLSPFMIELAGTEHLQELLDDPEFTLGESFEVFSVSNSISEIC